MKEALSGLQVLLLEDEPLLARRLAAVLKARGADVSPANSVQEATRLARAVPFDAALLDVNLPDGRGTDLLRPGTLSPDCVTLVMTAEGGVTGRRRSDKARRRRLPRETVRPRRAAPAPRACFARETPRPRRRIPRHRATHAPSRRHRPRLRPQPPPRRTATRTHPRRRPSAHRHPASRAHRRRDRHRQDHPRPLDPPRRPPRETSPHRDQLLRAPGSPRRVRTLRPRTRRLHRRLRHPASASWKPPEGGTLFLDEIPSLALPTQAKLLSAIEDQAIRRVGSNRTRPVNVRLIAASNVDLRERVQRGLFRADLLQRLDLFRVNLPPLRDRHDDLVPLAQQLATRIAAKYGRTAPTIPPAGAARLRAHRWPGNVRELAHEIERALVFHPDDALAFHSLAGSATRSDAWLNEHFAFPPEGFSLEAAIDTLIQRALAQAEGNVSAAARLLGVPRDYVRYRLKENTPQEP